MLVGSADDAALTTLLNDQDGLRTRLRALLASGARHMTDLKAQASPAKPLWRRRRCSPDFAVVQAPQGGARS